MIASHICPFAFGGLQPALQPPEPHGGDALLGRRLRAADSIVGPVSAPGSRSLELVLPAVPASVSHARRAVASLLDHLDVDLWAVRIVVSEAVANAVVHAYPDRAPGHVRLQAWLEHELLTVVVADDGVGMSSGRDSPGLGEGLAIIRRLAGEVEVHSGSGTRLVMRLRLCGGAV
jgi:anti-sigma regulatory factor (Ser/Thr protein kinase)